MPRLLAAGITPTANGLLLPLPQSLLNGIEIGAQAPALKARINQMRHDHLIQQQATNSSSSSEQCRIRPHASASTELSSMSGLSPELRELILDLYDIRCLLFGAFQQASGQIFNYYVDLRQIISDPALFHRVLDCYAAVLRRLSFDRVAGIQYGSLPTATGLVLQLHKPLVYPMKEVKAHGTRGMVEDEFNEGETVAVVDDILITGGSVLQGIAKFEGSRLKVEDVVVFLDHGGRQDPRAKVLLAKQGLRFHSVLNFEQITDVLEEAGRIRDEQARNLRYPTH